MVLGILIVIISIWNGITINCRLFGAPVSFFNSVKGFVGAIHHIPLNRNECNDLFYVSRQPSHQIPLILVHSPKFTVVFVSNKFHSKKHCCDKIIHWASKCWCNQPYTGSWSVVASSWWCRTSWRPFSSTFHGPLRTAPPWSCPRVWDWVACRVSGPWLLANDSPTCNLKERRRDVSVRDEAWLLNVCAVD